MTRRSQGLEVVLKEHPFFQELKAEHLKLLEGCGRNERFQPDQFLFREGEDADRFYVIREGKIRIELHSTRRGPIMLETIGPGDVLGWSWLVPPYQWRFDARALELSRVITMDGACLRGKCQDDPVLGYELLRRFTLVLADRLEAARLQLLDMYRSPAEKDEKHSGQG